MIYGTNVTGERGIKWTDKLYIPPRTWNIHKVKLRYARDFFLLIMSLIGWYFISFELCDKI